MPPGFAEFLVTAVLSLAITFVLFRWLESRAEGQSKVLGGTIKYGGALAGFVLVFWLSSHLYSRVFAGDDRTAIRLAGSYEIVQYRSDGQTRRGSATVHQQRGEPRFEISGEIESRSRPYPVEFHTIAGVLHERQLVWIYENDRREVGLALGTLRSERPDSFAVIYADLRSADLNSDPEGRIVFTRVRK